VNKWKILVRLVLVDFLALTAWVVAQAGLITVFEAAVATWPTRLLSVDLVLALALACGWMWADARRAGRNPWPFVALTLAAGSAGPLAYLLLRPEESVV